VLRTLEGEGREKIGMGLVVKNISWIYLDVLGLGSYDSLDWQARLLVGSSISHVPVIWWSLPIFRLR